MYDFVKLSVFEGGTLDIFTQVDYNGFSRLMVLLPYGIRTPGNNAVFFV